MSVTGFVYAIKTRKIAMTYCMEKLERSYKYWQEYKLFCNLSSHVLINAETWRMYRSLHHIF